jgi:hypothetical protein
VSPVDFASTILTSGTGSNALGPDEQHGRAFDGTRGSHSILDDLLRHTQAASSTAASAAGSSLPVAAAASFIDLQETASLAPAAASGFRVWLRPAAVDLALNPQLEGVLGGCAKNWPTAWDGRMYLPFWGGNAGGCCHSSRNMPLSPRPAQSLPGSRQHPGVDAASWGRPFEIHVVEVDPWLHAAGGTGDLDSSLALPAQQTHWQQRQAAQGREREGPSLPPRFYGVPERMPRSEPDDEWEAMGSEEGAGGVRDSVANRDGQGSHWPVGRGDSPAATTTDVAFLDSDSAGSGGSLSARVKDEADPMERV